MKQGPFPPAGLCCPVPSGGTTTPSDSLVAACHFPASPVIGRHCFPNPIGSGPPRASPVPTTTFRPFHAPYAGGFLGTRSRLSGAVHGLRHRNTGSAPSWPARAVILNDAAGFASCCGPVGCPPRTGGGLPPPRHRDLARRRKCCYRGPWRLPRPDSHRLAAVSLSLGYVVVPSFRWSSAPELLDAHSAGIGRTGGPTRRIHPCSAGVPEAEAAARSAPRHLQLPGAGQRYGGRAHGCATGWRCRWSSVAAARPGRLHHSQRPAAGQRSRPPALAAAGTRYGHRGRRRFKGRAAAGLGRGRRRWPGRPAGPGSGTSRPDGRGPRRGGGRGG